MKIDASRLSYLHQIVQTRPKTVITTALVVLGAVWVYQKIPGIVRYGCVENHRSLVTIFSRCLSRRQLKEISLKIIQEKNDLAFTNLLECSPVSTLFFEAVKENPNDLKMNCKVIKYLRDTQLVEVTKIIDFINQIFEQGARIYSFVNEGVLISDLFEIKDIDEPVTALGTSLLCIAAAENNLPLVRQLIARGARLDEKRYHPDYDAHLYPFEFAGQLSHFEMVELLLVDLNGYECRSRKFIKNVVKERFSLFIKLVLRGLKIPQNANMAELVMQKLSERHHEMSDEQFKALAERLIPQMVGHLTFKTLDELVQRVEVFFRAARCGCFDVNTPLNVEQKTLLHYAAQHRHHRVVTQLLDAGAHPTAKDERGLLPIHFALVSGRDPIIQLLLMKMIELDPTLLRTSVEQKNSRMVYGLLKCGVEVPDDELFICSIINLLIFDLHLPPMGDLELQELIKIVVSLSQRVNFLTHREVFFFLTKTERILRLLPLCQVIQGPIYKGGWTLMHWVATQGDHGRMKRLMDWGAPSTCQTEDFNITPLYIAVCNNHSACILQLASHAHLVQIPSSTPVSVGWDRFAIIEETPFEYSVRLGQEGVINLFIKALDDPHILLTTILKAVNLHEERRNNPQFHEFLLNCLYRVLSHSKAVRASVFPLVDGCSKFIEKKEISTELLQSFVAHHPYIPYFQKMGYKKVFGSEVRRPLREIFTKSPLGDCLQSYGHRLIRNPAATKQEVLLFREACIVAERMNNIFKQKPLVFIQPLLGRLTTFLERSTPHFETSFETAFDEKDGSCLVGEILVDEDRKWMIQCAIDASEMGLLEGRDFRCIGIDDNLAELTKIIERDPTKKERLSDELTRKREIFKRFEEHGVYLPQQLDVQHSQIRRWEFEVNITLLKWVLSQKDKVQKLLKEKQVESLSKLAGVDLIGFLVEKTL